MRAIGLSVVLLFAALVPVFAGAEKAQWQLAGKIKNGDYFLYYDPSSIKYTDNNRAYVSFRAREELSDEGLKNFKKKNYKAVKEAEKKAGSMAKGSEPLIETLAKFETKEYEAVIDCKGNEFRIPPSAASAVNFVIVNDIKPGSAEEKIKNAVCSPEAK